METAKLATDFDLGRNVFLAAESAAVDDFSQVTNEHLDAAVAYGTVQLVMPTRRSKKVLGLLKAEQASRNGGQS